MTAMSRGAAGGRLARAAVMIATITVLARLVGFVRTAVFARTVGSGCVGGVYQTANYIPNILFDIVAGGTLSALVVPLLAPLLSSGDRLMAARMLSALVTWAFMILGAITVVIVIFAGPITRALLGGHQCSGADHLGQRMLVVFAPQVIFYGLSVVLAGTLQASERFAWPALAPLLSSVVVVAAYLTYGSLVGTAQSAAGLSRGTELVLSLGTTAGVVVLAGALIPAAAGLGLRVRPVIRFPAGAAPFVRRAALAGGVTLAAQQVATVVMVRLANQGASGTLVVLTIAQAVYLVPWAVLAVPVATAIFPRLSAAWDAGDRERVSDLARSSLRVVSALAAVGTATLAAASTPIANVLLDRHNPAHSVFGPSIAAFAAGLLGWSLVAVLARLLYSARRAGLAAAGQAVGWSITIAADVVLARQFSSHDRAIVLAVGNALGVSVAAVLLTIAARRVHALDHLGATALSGARSIAAAAVGAAAGWSISRLIVNSGVLHSLLAGLAGALTAAAAAIAVLILSDRGLVSTLARIRALPEESVS